MIESPKRSATFSLTSCHIAAALVCLGMMLPAFGQLPFQTLLVGIDHRTVTRLNGDWHYLVDQSPGRAPNTANRKINHKPYAMNSYPGIVGRHNDEFDFTTAPTLKVPGDWNSQVPQLFNYEGVIWYQRDFDAKPKRSASTFLHIGAAAHTATLQPGIWPFPMAGSPELGSDVGKSHHHELSLRDVAAAYKRSRSGRSLVRRS